jgi:hypothetical protein
VAQILAPGPADRITAGQSLQVIGSAYTDDFAKYTLDVGQGDNPGFWMPITDQRVSVDKALLGVWNTSGLQPGRYRLRLRVFDRSFNAQESPPVFVNVGPAPAPTPQPSVMPTFVSTAPRATTTPGTTTPATTLPAIATPAQPTAESTPQPDRSPTPLRVTTRLG